MVMPSEYHLDALKELVNTGVGRAAASLNVMLDAHIELEVPSISILQSEDKTEEQDSIWHTELACVQLGFRGNFTGSAILVFPPESAVKLVSTLTGEDPEAPYLNAIMAGTLNEIGNIVINSVVGTIGNILDRPFDFSLPDYMEGKLANLLQSKSDGKPLTILLVRTHFRVRDRQVEGSIILLFELGSFDALLDAIDACSMPA
jgi:chemotaxis protein CheC